MGQLACVINYYLNPLILRQLIISKSVHFYFDAIDSKRPRWNVAVFDYLLALNDGKKSPGKNKNQRVDNKKHSKNFETENLEVEPVNKETEILEVQLEIIETEN